MAAPYRAQRSEVKFPIKAAYPVAVTWNDTVLIWGGYDCENNEEHSVSVIYCHQFGVWTKKTTGGDLPERVSSTAHVINDKLFVVGAMCDDFVVYSLNLKTWTWTKMQPSGNPPESSGSARLGMTSWTHNNKIFWF